MRKQEGKKRADYARATILVPAYWPLFVFSKALLMCASAKAVV